MVSVSVDALVRSHQSPSGNSEDAGWVGPAAKHCRCVEHRPHRQWSRGRDHRFRVRQHSRTSTIKSTRSMTSGEPSAGAAPPRRRIPDTAHTLPPQLLAAESRTNTRFQGVAPGARLIGLRVLGGKAGAGRAVSSARSHLRPEHGPRSDRHHQPLARPPDLRAGGDRSARAGRRSGVARRHRRRRLGGQLRGEPGDRRCGLRRHHLARATRRRPSRWAPPRHDGHDDARSTTGRDIQLARTDMVSTATAKPDIVAPGHELVRPTPTSSRSTQTTPTRQRCWRTAVPRRSAAPAWRPAS